MSIRKLRAILGAALLVAGLSAFALPAHVAAAGPWSCSGVIDVQGGSSTITGRLPLTTGTNETGVAATWNPPSAHDFANCTGLTDGAPQAVLDLHSEDFVTYCSSHVVLEECRITLGIKDDGALGYTYFYSRGGCDTGSGTSRGGLLYEVNLGSVGNWNSHDFEIVYFSSPQRWEGYIDGSLVVTGDPSGSATEQANWNAVSCWIGHNKDFGIYGARADLGDSLGNLTSGVGNFSSMQRKYSNAWNSLTGTSCEVVESTSHAHHINCSANGTQMFLRSNS